MADTNRFVYLFGGGKAQGRGDQKLLLGGKGAGLAEMTNIGLPVPAGFTITTRACAEYYRLGKRWPAKLQSQVRGGLDQLERRCKRRLGDSRDPLLVSVRSGAAVSMPGMMETILNLGLNDQSVEGLASVTGNRRFALDAYRRFIMMYGATAAGIEKSRFEEAFRSLKELGTRRRLQIPKSSQIKDTDVNEAELASLVDDFKRIYDDVTGQAFPQDPQEQLRGAINAVFNSWMAEKAVTYRCVEKISGLEGTAVNVCQMVFGNLGDDSGTGVCFTRDSSTGENTLYGDLLLNAQGEDVVAGIRTPMKIAELARLMPEIWEQLLGIRAILELHYKDMQDIEFTIERGKLYMLQCRTGKRSPAAAFRIAVEQATQPLLQKAEVKRLTAKNYLPKKYAARASRPAISKEDAILRIGPHDIERLFSPVIDPAVASAELERRRLGRGISAVPGAACGAVFFHPADAERQAAKGRSVLLVRRDTSPEDVGGMHAAAGILTATGGKTSHAAVVARGWGKCCIVGCQGLRINEAGKTMSLDSRTLREGDVLTLDGSAGAIYDGELPLVRSMASAEFDTLLKWCDQIGRLKVRTNADTPDDARKALELGAQGIGLCRTEHMFFSTQERRLAMQEMIVADSAPARRAALDKLQPFQKQDFLEIFEVMDGKPVTIRLIDPPLHEFLPHTPDDIQRLADYAGVTTGHIRHRTEQLHESNPMLGHRGCRLCITYPEILEMQTGAIMEAAVDATRQGVKVLPEIMIPLTIDARELQILTEQVTAVADAVLDHAGMDLTYEVGTMVETPRAALLADSIAGVARFISFGTNDLTQTTLGLSRDDAGRFLPAYIDQDKYGIFENDPFHSIDQEGVGRLVQWGVTRARQVHPNFKIGVCGEHGGETRSIKFFHRIGLDYVSCSPFRIPVARLAAAQAVIEQRSKRDAGRFGPKPVSRTKRVSSAKRATRPQRKAASKKKTSAKTKKKATLKVGKRRPATIKRKAAASAKKKHAPKTKISRKRSGKSAARVKGAAAKRSRTPKSHVSKSGTKQNRRTKAKRAKR